MAKTLLRNVARPGYFAVTLYDPNPRIGGMWPRRPTDTSSQLHPLMVANLSRHMVQFSDLAWDNDEPRVPRAWMVGRYLERYASTYLRDAELVLRTRVVTARCSTETGWDVTLRREPEPGDENCPKQEEMHRSFDFFVVASGFFGFPRTAVASFSKATIPVIHSGQYRDLQNLLRPSNGKRILVVGGQMSGFDLSATIAADLSSSLYSPKPSVIRNLGAYSIEHLMPRPVWVYPLFASPKVGAFLFLSLCLILFF